MRARVRDTTSACIRVHSPGDGTRCECNGRARAGKSDALSDEIRIYVAAASTATETT